MFDETDEYDCLEDHCYFIGCTCNHDPNQHGFRSCNRFGQYGVSCNVEGCECEGGWEE